MTRNPKFKPKKIENPPGESSSLAEEGTTTTEEEVLATVRSRVCSLPEQPWPQFTGGNEASLFRFPPFWAQLKAFEVILEATSLGN
jgi:hypothetical protein